MEPESASIPQAPVSDTSSATSDAAMPPHTQVQSPAPPNPAEQILTSPSPTTTAVGMAVAPPISPSASPPHINTESTLAPTSEYMRYLLAAWGSRYAIRGLIGTLLDDAKMAKGAETNAWWYQANRWLSSPGRWLQKKLPGSTLAQKEALVFSTTLGIGALALTTSYSNLVYKDIKNIFCEAVAAEFDKDPSQVTRADIDHSKNKMVQQTMHNFWSRFAQRAGIDLLFFPAALTRMERAGDFVLGLISGQLFLDTWKRKTTMFEDLVTFVNNKINPRNGLGQPIAQGEIFDLYQHYNEKFHPEAMFTNVLERGTGEGAIWAASQPIFARVAELMNQTYAYKHQSVIDPATGHAKPLANFTLPKFIYLMGNDLINTREPQRTLATIEIANQYGIPAVKQAVKLWEQGASTGQVLARFPVAPQAEKKIEEKGNEQNGVIAKGSTMQLDRVPGTQLDAATIQHRGPDAATALVPAV